MFAKASQRDFISQGLKNLRRRGCNARVGPVLPMLQHPPPLPGRAQSRAPRKKEVRAPKEASGDVPESPEASARARHYDRLPDRQEASAGVCGVRRSSLPLHVFRHPARELGTLLLPIQRQQPRVATAQRPAASCPASPHCPKRWWRTDQLLQESPLPSSSMASASRASSATARTARAPATLR